MEKNYLQVLLQLINGRGNIVRLQKSGLEFMKIGELMTLSVKEGYLAKKNNRITLTKKGQEKLKELNRTNKQNWIEPEVKSKIVPIDVNFIFLPNQDELFLD